MPDLFNETGHDSIDQRNTEAIRLLDELSTNMEQMQPHERSFIIDMCDRKDRNVLRCTGKQLYWLRDLYGKYVLEE
jgi:hypothetical protein